MTLPLEVPLGITASKSAAATWQSVSLAPGDRIYACSDGLTELTNPAGEEFGSARLERLLVEAGGCSGLARLRDAALAFLAAGKADDDVTVIELVAPASGPGGASDAGRSAGRKTATLVPNQ